MLKQNVIQFRDNVVINLGCDSLKTHIAVKKVGTDP